MSRVAPNNIKTFIIGAAVVLTAAGSVAGAVIANSPAHKVGVAVNAQNQLTDVKYNGQAGVDGLTLLKRHARVQVKHYSFGDFVEAINGSAGNGPKYWTFYINGKEANVGAGAYITKTSDKLEWKLQ